MSIQILAPTTDAANSESFDIVADDQHVTLLTTGLADSSEHADLQIWVNGNFADAYDENGTQIRITGPGNTLKIRSKGRYRVQKETTGAVSGVWLIK